MQILYVYLNKRKHIFYFGLFWESIQIFALFWIRWGDYERPVGSFHPHEFTFLTSWIHVLNVRNSQIQDFYFTNSRFQLHEFTISTSWIHDFNFMHSRLQLHEFTISTSWIQNFNFTNSTSWIHDFNFTKSRFQLHEFTISTSWIHDFNSIHSQFQPQCICHVAVTSFVAILKN
jgi:hypothetical protein